MTDRQQQAPPEPTKMDRVVSWVGRGLLFLSSILFVGLWTWYFFAAMAAGDRSWAFWSLMLFALFLLISTLLPRGQIAKLEIAFAWARMRVEYEAESRVAEILEKAIQGLPEQTHKAVEEVKPQIIQEAKQAVAQIYATYQSEVYRALTSSGATPVGSGGFPGALTWADWDNPYVRERLLSPGWRLAGPHAYPPEREKKE